jgi:hypothetical protein
MPAQLAKFGGSVTKELGLKTSSIYPIPIIFVNTFVTIDKNNHSCYNTSQM